MLKRLGSVDCESKEKQVRLLSVSLVSTRYEPWERVMKDMKDDELRDKVRAKFSHVNGGYATKICRRCEAYYPDPSGDTSTAKIVECCPACYRDHVKDLNDQLLVAKAPLWGRLKLMVRKLGRSKVLL